jgi:hypothetical protein
MIWRVDAYSDRTNAFIGLISRLLQGSVAFLTSVILLVPGLVYGNTRFVTGNLDLDTVRASAR